MAKFKIGDKVRVRKDIVVGEYSCNNCNCNGISFIGDMIKYKDNIYTIEDMDDCENYILDGCGGFAFSDDMVEPVEFTKQDLKDGLVVEFKNNSDYVIKPDEVFQVVYGAYLHGIRKIVRLSEYNDDLTHPLYDSLTIIRVYKPRDENWTYTELVNGKKEYLELLWERKEEESHKEMTVAEIEEKLGYKIKVVADKE